MEKRLHRCDCCGGHRKPPQPDGWGSKVDVWAAWPCLYCGLVVCNWPVGQTICYVEHTAQEHDPAG